jgi:Fe2+ transport system protein FeoA
MKFAALTHENRKKLLDMGFTEEELIKAEDGDKIL